MGFLERLFGERGNYESLPRPEGLTPPESGDGPVARPMANPELIIGSKLSNAESCVCMKVRFDQGSAEVGLKDPDTVVRVIRDLLAISMSVWPEAPKWELVRSPPAGGQTTAPSAPAPER